MNNSFTARNGEPAYLPDYDIDTPEDTLADELGTTPAVARKVISMLQAAEVRQQALTLGKVVGLLLETNNLPVMANAIAFAAGLDQLNGKMSQAQVARELGVTRALVSHYTVGVRDVLSGKRDTFDCTKFRKRNSSRETFRAKATDPHTAAKSAAIARYRASLKTTTP
jgi:predicted transcriptional regulator